MATVPSKYVEKIQFFEDHLPLFVANATAIGTTSGDVTLLQTRTTSARTLYSAQQTAALASKNATAALLTALELMGDQGAAIIKQIRAKADITSNPNVYVLAGIPAPATPTTPADPGTPCNFKLSLKNNGAVGFSWSCVNPENAKGTIYQIYRSLDGGPTVNIGASGKRSYLDSTIPAGTAKAVYQLQGTRTNAAGEWAEFNVNFGVATGGGMTASISPTSSKRAA